jgi:hypothetical protein
MARRGFPSAVALIAVIASGVGNWAPDAEDLADIYRRIAMMIPCPREQFWGRR